jgi:hypothetical protein
VAVEVQVILLLVVMEVLVEEVGVLLVVVLHQ